MKFTTLTLPSTIACSIALLCTAPAHAQDDGTWSFKSVSLNSAMFTPRTKNTTGSGPFAQKGNFPYAEIEGGLGGKWGDLYGFMDIENPLNKKEESNTMKDRRYATKAIANFKMTEVAGMNVNLHAQVYDFVNRDFNNQNRVLGLSTNIFKNGFWMKPFVGLHHELLTGAGSASNGYMLGWVAGYDFKLGNQNMGLTSWHETEVGRKDQFLNMARDGKVVKSSPTAQNGALVLSWKATPTVSFAASYRYVSNKLGSATYQDALLLTAKYSF